MCKCNHCEYLFLLGATSTSGVGCAVVNNYIISNGSRYVQLKTILLGIERAGRYANQYNICGGKRDTLDECFIDAATRELFEEFKLQLTRDEFITRCIRKNRLNVVVIGKTPVFVIEFTGLKRSTCNKIINNHNTDLQLGNQYKEMKRVDWFQINPLIIIPEQYLTKLNNHQNNHSISIYAKQVCQTIVYQRLFN